MAFQQGLSGLNAASRNLDVIGHNIANANTVGMKSSRAEFAELYASSVGASGGISQGIGVSIATVSQAFTQGNLTITGRDMDVAINGNGFFAMSMPDGSLQYSRDGQFKLDRDGRILNNQGGQLMGYPTDVDGNRTAFDPIALSLPTGGPIPANETKTITAEFNLDARATGAEPAGTYGTTVLVYDQQGKAIPVAMAFEKQANNQWQITATMTDEAGVVQPLGNFNIAFNPDGSFDEANSDPVEFDVLSLNAANGADFPVTVNLENITQFASPFSVTNLTQDGYPPGELTSLQIEDNGVIMARYSNGESQAAGQIQLVNFRNAQGLAPVGGNGWVATFASGAPIPGAPGEGNMGMLKAGAVEDSNVDLTAELVNMMTAQRAYQANAQTIKTQDQIMSTLLNMR
ncbi:flagellar hook protein FlgE [Hydrogenophaga bisanensis]|uniref:Flagellar hook protein FlgE n=1 Tax=Hydrogenophaga bisanensis TaxID=439611 RepID=A0ABW2R9R3_9BURK